MKIDFSIKLPVSRVCLIAAACFVEFQVAAQESKWPPLSTELIERIERLPQERLIVQEKANQISGESKAELGESYIVTHWKPLLVVLIGRGENLGREQAAKRYEQIMGVQQLLTQASLTSEDGLLTAAGVEYIRPDRVATENLLAYYVQQVMFPDHWDLDTFLDWNRRWRADGDTTEPSAEPVEMEDAHSLVGHWEADPEMGMFAYAVITPSRLVLIWEEGSESPARIYDAHPYRVGEERIYQSPDDVGLPYLLSKDEDGRETLNLEVRSEDTAMVKMEIPLIRVEMPALSRP